MEPGGSNTSLLSILFGIAIEKDDIQQLMSLLTTNPGLLVQVANTCGENPLRAAFRCRSFRVAAGIARIKLGYLKEKEEDGSTLLHLACRRRDVEMLRVLLQLIDPQLCLVRNNSSVIPLHLAVKYGHADLITELLSACPKSLEKLTRQQKTVFHLAAEENHSDAFELLLAEAEIHNLEHLLCLTDQQGNTVLHIAVSKNLIRIVKLLLPESQSSQSFTAHDFVNSINGCGFTALDLYYRSHHHDLAAQEIGHMLQYAGALEARVSAPHKTLHNNHSTASIPPWWFLDTRNVLLVILAIFVGAGFNAACSLLPSFPTETFVVNEAFHFKHVVSGELPPVFYIMVFITVDITLSLGIIVVLLYSLPFGNFLLLAVVAVLLLYALLANNTVPKFSVKVGCDYISSTRLMWILAVSFILSGAVAMLLVKCFMVGFYKFNEWLKTKQLVSNLVFGIKAVGAFFTQPRNRRRSHIRRR